MKIIDITKEIFSGMHVYPTDPNVEIIQFKSLVNGDSCNLQKISFGTHTGTHIDAPLHILKEGQSIDEINLGNLICKVLVENKEIIKNLKIADDIRGVLVKNGFINMKEARKLVGQGIGLIGVSCDSIEDSSDKAHPVHRLFLENKIIIVENLDLKDVVSGVYQLICLPLKIKRSDGSPVRAVLIVI